MRKYFLGKGDRIIRLSLTFFSIRVNLWLSKEVGRRFEYEYLEAVFELFIYT